MESLELSASVGVALKEQGFVGKKRTCAGGSAVIAIVLREAILNRPPVEMKITKIAFYVRDIPLIAEFYARHFGFTVRYNEKKDKAVLSPSAGGCRLILLQASKGHKIGQSIVKLLFDVPDVAAAKEEHAKKGLMFGSIHSGPTYRFANARDPAKNLISISDAHLVDE